MVEQATKFNEKYYDYLDTLRETGITNMFGAGPYLRNAFPELTKAQSYEVLADWGDTFPREPTDG